MIAPVLDPRAPDSRQPQANQLQARAQARTRACVFSLGDSLFAVASSYARQVVDVESLSAVPSRNADFLGLFAVRGQILPLLTLAPTLGLAVEVSPARALVVHSNVLDAAFSVTRVLDFINLPALDSVGVVHKKMQLFAAGQFEYAGQRVVLLDIPRLFNAFESAVV